VSYILDAIKQSERQRSRERVPNVNSWQPEIQDTAAPRHRWWWPLLGLALLFSVIGWVLLGEHPLASPTINQAQSSPVPASTPLAQADPVNDNADDELLLMPQEALQLALPIRLDTDEVMSQPRRGIASSGQAKPMAASRGGADKPDAGDGRLQATGDEVSAPAVSVSASDTSSNNSPAMAEARASATVPYWRQLPVEVQRRLPEIQFTLHVYAQDPAQRMVKVNGRIAREGQYVGTSLRLDQIVPDGVILSFEGQKFMMKVN